MSRANPASGELLPGPDERGPSAHTIANVAIAPAMKPASAPFHPKGREAVDVIDGYSTAFIRPRGSEPRTSWTNGGHVSSERTKTKKEQQAADRAAFKRRQQRNAWLWRGAGILAVTGAASGAGYCYWSDREFTKSMVTGSYQAGVHTPGRIAYVESPPIGGPHNVVWQNCGVYGQPIHNEHAVHALEHGAVWIAYRPDLPESELEALRKAAGDDYMLLSPYPGLRAPIVLSSWNHQLAIDRADDARLPKFISSYKNNPGTTPEFGAPCTGGTTVSAEADSLNTGSGSMAR